MKIFRMASIVFGVFFILAFITSTSFAQAPVTAEEPMPVLAEDFAVNATDPYPVAPNYNNNVYTKLPKYFFSQAGSATQYQIEIENTWNPGTTLFTYTGPATCANHLCWVQPVYKLKTVNIDFTKGFYSWRVRTIPSGSWSSFEGFNVQSTGFTSTFDSNTNKWTEVSGDWTRVETGFYKTLGVPGTFASAAQTEFFLDNFVYEVRLKRKVETSYNSIIFNGAPGTLTADNHWKAGYYFRYGNDGYWSLAKRVDGIITNVSGNSFSPFIDPYGWNTLTVWRSTPLIHLWINGAYLGVFVDSSFSTGFVGVGMPETDLDKSPLLVDYAKLYYSAISPYAITDAVMGEPHNSQVEGEGLTD